MLGKRSTPLIGKLTGPAVSGTGIRRLDAGATSPRSPLELKTQSPKGRKSYDLGGVGLGIVAALEKSGNFGTQKAFNKASCNRNLNPSKPIPVNSGHNSSARCRKGFEEVEMDSFEEYTFVTCRGPDNKSYTKVYCDGVDKTVFDQTSVKCNFGIICDESPARRFGDFSAYPTSDFLSSCHLCQKKLHGKDIYMYRGEKAFCSPECRYRQIVMDERQEKCGSEAAASRSVDLSTSPYTSDQIFSTGILAI